MKKIENVICLFFFFVGIMLVVIALIVFIANRVFRTIV
jgi:hypothetical protein